jgi:transposase
LTDPGFDHTVLSDFRTRLVTGQAEPLRLETWLTQVCARGLLKVRGRQRTDSTHVLVAPDWLRAHAPSEWFDRDGTRVEHDHLPHTTAARVALAAATDLPWLQQVPAVQTLRQVWAEQYTDPLGPPR